MPAPDDLRAKCANCGHAFSFHGKQVGGACRAMGCHGKDGERCVCFEFLPEDQRPVEAAAKPLKR